MESQPLACSTSLCLSFIQSPHPNLPPLRPDAPAILQSSSSHWPSSCNTSALWSPVLLLYTSCVSLANTYSSFPFLKGLPGNLDLSYTLTFQLKTPSLVSLQYTLLLSTHLSARCSPPRQQGPLGHLCPSLPPQNTA